MPDGEGDGDCDGTDDGGFHVPDKDFYDFCMKLKPMVADEDNYGDDDCHANDGDFDDDNGQK